MTAIITGALDIDVPVSRRAVCQPGWLAIYNVLAGAPDGATVRLNIGDARWCEPPPEISDALDRVVPLRIEVTGSDPAGVRALCTTLRGAAR